MAITVADNFSYQGKKPLDGRDTFATLAAMKAYAEASVYDGCLSYCDEDGKRYEFKSTNTIDPTTGRWREYSSGGGGETYSDFTGATSSTAGAHGLVPAPSAGDEGKVLFGNGAWGALPSVDLSVLSNEAFILSTTEKAVGMDTDGKLLYAKTVDCGALPNATYKEVAHNISNIEKAIIVGRASNQSASLPIPFVNVENTADQISAYVTSTAVRITAGVDRSGFTNSTVTLFYTKTTDSPLPSDVKFAGVTASGEVILEKTLTGISVESVSGQWVNVVDISTLSVGKLIDVVFRQTSEKCIAAGGARVNGSNLQIFSYVAFGINEVTIKYTLAS